MVVFPFWIIEDGIIINTLKKTIKMKDEL